MISVGPKGELITIIPGYKERPWEPSTPMKRPAYCLNCPYQKIGYGFCPDFRGKNPKVAVMFDAPSSDDLNAQRGLAGSMGWFAYKSFFEPAGFARDEIIVSHVIRCRPPRDKKGKPSFPTGKTKVKAIKVCRKFDGQHGEKSKLVKGGLAGWSPNLILLTYNPADVKLNPAYHRQILRDMKKTAMLVEKGYKPLVLMGKEAAILFAPHIVTNGGVKGWRGDYYEIGPNELLLTDTDDGGFVEI